MSITLKQDEEQVKTIIDFYVLTTKLKDTIRTGWKHRGIKRERVESVAEHIFGTCMLAIAVWSETLPDVNLSEVLTMLAIHETEEIIISDIAPFDGVSPEEKRRMGHEAIKKIFSILKIPP